MSKSLVVSLRHCILCAGLSGSNHESTHPILNRIFVCSAPLASLLLPPQFHCADGTCTDTSCFGVGGLFPSSTNSGPDAEEDSGGAPTSVQVTSEGTYTTDGTTTTFVPASQLAQVDISGLGAASTTLKAAVNQAPAITLLETPSLPQVRACLPVCVCVCGCVGDRGCRHSFAAMSCHVHALTATLPDSITEHLRPRPPPCPPLQSITLPRDAGYRNCRVGQEPQPGALCELGATAVDPEEGDISSRVGVRGWGTLPAWALWSGGGGIR